MANRREFLQAGLAASALAALIPAAAAKTSVPVAFHTVLFDQRFADSVLFAEQFSEQGIAVHGMAKGDITPFWRNELAAAWAEAPVALAGMTTEGPLFCLEQLGAQYGLRVARREPQASGLTAWVLLPKHLV
jgi:hypothetical protein